MKIKLIMMLSIIGLSGTVMADNYFFCPQNHKYIQVGMSMAQVIDACGAPISRQQSAVPATTKVEVKQLMFNREASPRAFYGVWQIPVGVNSGGDLEVDIINDKVAEIHVNGSSENAFSFCNGNSVQIGDPVTSVYNSCGNPSMSNSTFIYQPIESNEAPEIWIYQPTQYQSPISLTFVNGNLQSIN